MKSTTKSEDYDIVVGKLARRKKNGEDISDDTLGPGGRRNEKGEFSALVQDIQIVDRNEIDSPKDRPASPEQIRQLEYYIAQEEEYKQELKLEHAKAFNNTLNFINNIIKFDREHPEYRKAIIKGVKKAAAFLSKKGTQISEFIKQKQEKTQNLNNNPDIIPVEPTSKVMSEAEAKEKMLECFYYITQARSIAQDLANSTIGYDTDSILKSLNEIATVHPSLLNENERKTLYNEIIKINDKPLREKALAILENTKNRNS